MIKELHGKYYYIELKNFMELHEVIDLIKSEESLKDEKFNLSRVPGGNWIVLSEAPCEHFRGEKYSSWEKVKRKLYTLRRES